MTRTPYASQWPPWAVPWYLKSPTTLLFVQQLDKKNVKALHYWPFVKAIHSWPVDSPHKGQVIWKMLPFPRSSCHVSLTMEKKVSVNPFWPTDAIWWHRTESNLVQVMAFCLMAPSHYLKQCWLIISKVQWHLFVGNFIEILQTSSTKIGLIINYLKFHSNLPRANEVRDKTLHM